MKTDAEFAADKEARHWCEVIARCGNVSALDLDDILAPHDKLAAQTPGRALDVPVQGQILHNTALTRPAIGVLTDNREITPSYVVTLAALAVEKDCAIIAITSKDVSRLEAYGIRTECVGGGCTPEAIDQVKRLWGIELVI